MGAAAAALLQDDAIVRALYESYRPGPILDAIDARLRAVRVLPRTTRPTKKSLKARESRMCDELAGLKQRLIEAGSRVFCGGVRRGRFDFDDASSTGVEHTPLLQVEARAEAGRGDDETPSLAGTARGGLVLRVDYADQNSRWKHREKRVFRRGFSVRGRRRKLPGRAPRRASRGVVRRTFNPQVTSIVAFAQKYALPLLAGIILAVVLANTDEDAYNRWCGVSHHRRRRLSGGDDDDGVNHPTFFGLSIRRHVRGGVDLPRRAS